MAKDINQAVTDALDELVEKVDMDGVLYRLTQVAVRRRNEADAGTNKGEQRYWQQMVELLNDTTSKCEGISG